MSRWDFNFPDGRPACPYCRGFGAHEEGDADYDGRWKRVGYTECDECRGTGYKRKRDQEWALSLRAARTPMSVSGAQFHEAMNAVNSPTMTFGDARALLRALGIEVTND